jgi:hypothetical protein
MDLQKLVELLDHYPPWFRWSIAIWVVAGALLLVGFLTLRQPRANSHASEASSPQLPHRQPVATPPASETGASTSHSPQPLTFLEYQRRLRSLQERFLERQEFLNAMSGTVVAWQGLVSDISEKAAPRPTLFLTIESSEGQITMSALVTLPGSLRTKAFSLRRGDTVRVVGKLTLSTPNYPDIDATELVLVRAKHGR